MKINRVCPRDCPGRSEDCHTSCKDYKKQWENSQKVYKSRLEAVKIADVSFDGFRRRGRSK